MYPCHASPMQLDQAIRYQLMLHSFPWVPHCYLSPSKSINTHPGVTSAESVACPPAVEKPPSTTPLIFQRFAQLRVSGHQHCKKGDHLLWQAMSSPLQFFSSLLRWLAPERLSKGRRAPGPGSSRWWLQSEGAQCFFSSTPCSSANCYTGDYNTSPSKRQGSLLKAIARSWREVIRMSSK